MLNGTETPRGKLLQAAAHLFKQYGYERTTVRDLGNAVGLQSGSIFHHFATKQDILHAVMEEAIHAITQRLEIAVISAETPRGRIKALIRCELESLLGETGEALAVLVYEWRSLSPDRQEKLLELRERYERIWLDALEQCQQAGLLAGDPLVVRRLLGGAIMGTINWYQKEGSLGLDALAEQATTMVVNS